MEGVCRYIHEVLQRMVIDHPEDEFYFFFDRKYDPKFIYADNVKPVVIGPQARHPFLWYWWFEHSLPRAFKKYDIDVFYSGDTYMSLKTKVPTVLVSHDIAYAHYPKHIPNLNLKYYRRFFPKFHQQAKKVIAVSNFTKEDITKQYDLDKDKVVLGYNAQKEGLQILDSQRQQNIKNKFAEGKDYFLYLGSIHPRKNVESIIAAFESFKQHSSSDKKLLLVGRLAWNVSVFRQALNRSNYASDIVHLENLSNQDVTEITASAYAMVYVSLFEGFGLPILEAMHCEVPVICSNVSSMPEVAGNAAILVNPQNTDEIAEAMIELNANASLRNELIVKGRRQREKFNWKSTADITYDAIREAAKLR